ncbi:MAG: hypothetical protein HN348_08150 [Proteobacteria bacterium]|jgi:hypothetical protein|nr:hypothetical protein [Pseudomonadota bacterium]
MHPGAQWGRPSSEVDALMFWLFLSFISNPALAQEEAEETQDPAIVAILKGRVLERGSGVPVAVTIVVGEHSIEIGADGSFEFVGSAGLVQVQIKSDAHRPLTMVETLAPGLEMEVTYRVERCSWEEIIVFGEAIREEVARKVISIEELTSIPGSFGNPIRALQSLPGMARPNLAEVDLVIRGAEGINTRFYVDEIPVPYLFHWFVGRSPSQRRWHGLWRRRTTQGATQQRLV